VQKQPNAPQAPTTAAPNVVPISALPITAQDVRGLRIRIDDLREQLQDAASRRSNIAGQLPRADPSARPGIEARMGELDSRILRIEKDISEASRQLTNAPSTALTAARGWPNEFPGRAGKDMVPIVAILSVFVFAPFAIAMSRLIWKRASVAVPRVAATDHATTQRLEQLQQSLDTIAIEVERISEGQRFVTKLFNERPAVGAGEAQPVHAAKKAAMPSERG
jgi:hypothetical protein